MPRRSHRRQRPARPPMMIVVPVLLFLLLAAGWGVVWYEASRRASAMMDTWLAAEAAKGRSYECAGREIGGFPFRAELTCEGVTAEITDAEPHFRIEAARLRAVAVIWQLEHVIVEVDGPVRVASLSAGEESADSSAHAVTADWSLAQASMRVPGGRISRIDLAINDFEAATDSDGTQTPLPLALAAERIELHERHGGDGASAEIAFSAAGLVVTPANNEPTRPVDLAGSGQIGALPQPLPRDPRQFLAAWRDNGGFLEIGYLRAAQDETVVSASGLLAPDAEGRPEGTVTVTMSGPEADAPGTTGAFAGLAGVLATALHLAGQPADLDGRAAVSGEVRLEEGRIFFGPLPIGRIPEIF